MLESVLVELEASILNQPADLQLTIIPADRWILVSTMHKSIRRGDAKTASRAAISLLKTDPRSFWNRLHIIALEDVNIGSPETLVKVLAASAATSWRKKVGDVQVGIYLTKLLCQGAKTRISDFIFIQAERGNAYDDVRKTFADSDDNSLTDVVLDTSRDLVERSTALWFLAGSQKFPSDYMPSRQGSVDKAITTLRALNTPGDLTEACVAAIKLSRYPLSLITPLIWQEMQKSKPSIRFNAITPANDINGIPDIALDQFTRGGNSCMRELQRTVPCMREFSAKQVALSAFYEQGGLIDVELTSPELEIIKAAGQATDLEGVGLDSRHYQVLRDCLNENFGELAAIRKEYLQQYSRSVA